MHISLEPHVSLAIPSVSAVLATLSAVPLAHQANSIGLLSKIVPIAQETVSPVIQMDHARIAELVSWCIIHLAEVAYFHVLLAWPAILLSALPATKDFN